MLMEVLPRRQEATCSKPLRFRRSRSDVTSLMFLCKWHTSSNESPTHGFIHLNRETSCVSDVLLGYEKYHLVERNDRCENSSPVTLSFALLLSCHGNSDRPVRVQQNHHLPVHFSPK